MTEDEARRVQRALELLGLPGEARPTVPADPAGAWHIELDGKDVTLQSLDALIERLGGTPAEPGWHDGRPVRGFIVPEPGNG